MCLYSLFVGRLYTMHEMNLVERVLAMALTVALLCSLWIAYRVYVLRDGHYRTGFSTWQLPMIFAILADLYLLR